MELEGNSNSGTSVAFLTHCPGENTLARCGSSGCAFPTVSRPVLVLRTSDLTCGPVNLAGVQPRFTRPMTGHLGLDQREATGNLCLGSRAAAQEMVRQLPSRTLPAG